jgi:ferredoxin-NADP reductase
MTTQALIKMSPNSAETSQESQDSLPHPWRLYVDGPYGAPSQDWFLYDAAILIGAGIGITPFASVLQDIIHSLEHSKVNARKPLQRRMTRRNTTVLKLSGGRSAKLKKVGPYFNK